MILALLFLAFANATPTTTTFPEFCSKRGYDNCFAINQLQIEPELLTINEHDTIRIKDFYQHRDYNHPDASASYYDFSTNWGDAVMVKLPTGTFTAEIPLKHDFVLHIYPCFDGDDCMSFGYVMHEELEDSEEIGDSTEGEDNDEEPELRRKLAGHDQQLTNAILERRNLNALSEDCAWVKVDRYSSYQNHPTADELRDLCGSNCDSHFDLSSFEICAIQGADLMGSVFGQHYPDHLTDERSRDNVVHDYECWIVERCSFSLTGVFADGTTSGERAFENANLHLIVEEFNAVMHNSGLPHYMYLHSTVRGSFDINEYGKPACYEFAQTLSTQTDFVHCILPHKMGRVSPGVWNYGAAYFPTASVQASNPDSLGVSFSRLDTMPSETHGGRHTAAHEMIHNLNGRHTDTGTKGKSTMYRGSGSSERLLRIFNSRTGADASTVGIVQKNIKRVNLNADYLAASE